MELMSMLLFCAFVVRLQPALGIYMESDMEDVDIKFNRRIMGTNSTVNHHKDNDSKNDASRIISDINPFFLGSRCKHCSACVQKALDAYNFNQNIGNPCPVLGDSQQIPNNTLRFKRNSSNLNNTQIVEKNNYKNVRVTKYISAEDKVYALKVNEIIGDASKSNDRKSTCKVYSVKKAFPCETEESDLILMKRKTNKKRISKQKNTSTTTPKSIPTVSLTGNILKIHAETSNVPESFLTSIEDLY